MAAYGAHDALLSHLCSSRECRLRFAMLMCCAAVSRSWRNAVLSGLPMLHALDFRDSEARLAGADVLRALKRVAGANLRFLDLIGCRLLSGADMAQIMGVVRASCRHAQTTVDVSGCSDEARLSAVAECAQSVLGAASPWALFELLAVLLSASADLNPADNDGNTPLLAASAGGHLKLAKVLIDAGAGISAADKQGNTPLLAASDGGHLELAKVLIDAGARISAAYKQGNTPLLAASEGGHLEIAKVLIDAGAGIFDANREGNTPLLAASEVGHLELAKLLIDVGANVQATRTDGAGLLALAIVSQKEEFVIFAFQHGPRRLEGQGSSYAASNVAQFSQLFLDPSQIGNWLQCGALPEGLIGEIGALLSSAFVDQLVKGKLENLRAFISHHNTVLQDPSRWPVLHFVEQLASQETDNTFQSAPTGAQASGHLEEKVDIGAFIQRVNPRQGRRAY